MFSNRLCPTMVRPYVGQSRPRVRLTLSYGPCLRFVTFPVCPCSTMGVFSSEPVRETFIACRYLLFKSSLHDSRGKKGPA